MDYCVNLPKHVVAEASEVIDGITVVSVTLLIEAMFGSRWWEADYEEYMSAVEEFASINSASIYTTCDKHGQYKAVAKAEADGNPMVIFNYEG